MSTQVPHQLAALITETAAAVGLSPEALFEHNAELRGKALWVAKMMTDLATCMAAVDGSMDWAQKNADAGRAYYLAYVQLDAQCFALKHGHQSSKQL